MKTVEICVGSSCHLKGSYEVIQQFQQLIKDKNLEEKLELRAAFCLGHCTKAVSVRLPDQQIIGVSPKSLHQQFEQQIMPML
ncbi:MAG TPA: hypothetical protein DCY20_11040 [Firmicutes bacterium]|nr:hypothetical protein [Bacillota bacterium]